MSQKGRYIPPSLDDPCPTIATQGRLALASVSFLSKQYSGEPYEKNIPVDGPAGSITTIDHHAFISVHYGNGFNTSCERPASTLTTKDRLALVSVNFLDMQSGNGSPTSIDSVAGTITTNPKHHMVTVKPWIMDTNFGNIGSKCVRRGMYEGCKKIEN